MGKFFSSEPMTLEDQRRLEEKHREQTIEEQQSPWYRDLLYLLIGPFMGSALEESSKRHRDRIQ